MKKGLSRNLTFDEMQEKAIGRAGIICTVITVIYLLAISIYKYIMTKDILKCSEELGLLMIICVVFYLCIGNQKEMNLPKTITGITLPTDENKVSIRKRFFAYLIDSLMFSVALIIITYVFERTTKHLLLEGISLFLVSLILDYIIGEIRCKKYRQWEKELDNE